MIIPLSPLPVIVHVFPHDYRPSRLYTLFQSLLGPFVLCNGKTVCTCLWGRRSGIRTLLLVQTEVREKLAGMYDVKSVDCISVFGFRTQVRPNLPVEYVRAWASFPCRILNPQIDKLKLRSIFSNRRGVSCLLLEH